MTHYCVDFIGDSGTGASVDLTWTDGARTEGVGRVRAAVLADSAGKVNWPLLARGVGAWKAAGVPVDGVCAYEYLPPFVDAHGVTQYPGAPVGTGTHRLTTPYIERFRLQLERHAPALLAAGMDGFYAWNEPQVALVHAANAPNPPNVNRSALAPETYAALVWQTCHSLEHIGCKRRIAGAFNILPQSGLDPKNPYVLGYLGAVYAHLKSCGVRPNWTHLGITSEGYWTVQTAQHVHDVLRAFMDAHGDHAELVIAEMGVRNHGADLDRLLTTCLAMEAVYGVGNAAYFSRPGLVPYLGDPLAYTDYGAKQWRQDGNHYQVGAGYPIAPTIERWLAT